MSNKFKFNKVKDQNAVEGATATYLMYERVTTDKKGVEYNPEFTVVHAPDCKEFIDEVQAREVKREAIPEKYRLKGKAQEKEQHEENCELFAKYIIQDWKDVYDDDGNAVGFCQEACLAFLMAVTPSKLIRLVQFCSDDYNFSKASASKITPAEADTVAKNSPGDTSSS